jgi:hypothetical protein
MALPLAAGAVLAAAAPDLIKFGLETGRTLIDRLWPDKEKYAREREQAEYELLKMTQTERMTDKANEVAIAIAQIDVNKEEAKTGNLFIAGWRPGIGWICALSYGYAFLIGPLVTQISSAYGYSFPLPPIDMDNMLYVLGGLLGLGGLRTFEKVKGITK